MSYLTFVAFALSTVVAFALGLMASAFVRPLRRNTSFGVDVDRLAAAFPVIVYTAAVLPDGSFQRRYLSSSAGRITGWSRQELDKDDGLSFLGDPHKVEPLSAFFLEVLRDTRTTSEYRFRHGDDTWHWMRSIAVCLDRHSAGGGLVLGIVADVSADHAVSLKLQDFESRTSLADCISIISHELRQPVSTIAMAAENGAGALSRTPAAVDYAGEKFSRIAAQAARIESIVAGVRTLVAYSATFEPEAVNLASVVGAALARLRTSLVQDGIDVHTDIQPGLSPVFGEPAILEQVFANIVENACDAYRRQPGGGPRPLWIAARQDGFNAFVSVSDAAGGMAGDLLDRLFKPFVTGKVAGKNGGIGLAIAQISIARMGGHIVAKNAGNGATIEIDLPAVLAESRPTMALRSAALGTKA